MIDNAILHTIQPTLFSLDKSLNEPKVLDKIQRRSISKEKTFRYETINTVQVKTILVNMIEHMARELRRLRKCSTIISIKIRYANGKTHTKRKHISYTANQNLLTHYAKDLFNELYNGQDKIKLVGLKISGFVQSKDPQKMNSANIHDLPLMHQVDDIRRRFGVEKIMQATCMRELIENASALAS